MKMLHINLEGRELKVPVKSTILALIAAIYITVFRRGYNTGPGIENGGLGIMLMSMLLALIQPTALLALGGALVLYVGVSYGLTREFPIHELRWSAMLWLPALPFAVYDFAVFQYNDIMGRFNEQNITPSPPVYLMLIAFLPLQNYPVRVGTHTTGRPRRRAAAATEVYSWWMPALPPKPPPMSVPRTLTASSGNPIARAI